MSLEKLNSFSVKSFSHTTAFTPYIHTACGVMNYKPCSLCANNCKPIQNAHNSSKYLSS